MVAAYFTIVSLWPFIFNLFLSFMKTDLISGYRFVGLSNYRFLAKDPVFFKSLWHNIFYILVLISVGITTSLVLSSLIYRTYGFSKKIYTALHFTPVVTSMVAVSLIWNLLYYPKIGVFAVLLTKFFHVQPQLFLADSKIALLCIIIMDIWKETGIRVVVLLAGMQEIPKTVYEAARIDGASPISQFFKITIPLLRPQITFLVAIYSINALRVFTQVFMMTGNPPGGPANSTKTLSIHMYQEAFYSLRFGYGATIAIIIFILLFGLVLFQIRAFKQTWEY